MIDPVVIYYKEANQEGDKKPISVDEFIKLSLSINSQDFQKKHGREMTKQERDLAKQAINVSKQFQMAQETLEDIIRTISYCDNSEAYLIWRMYQLQDAPHDYAGGTILPKNY